MQQDNIKWQDKGQNKWQDKAAVAAKEPESNVSKYVLTAVIAFLVGFGSSWLYLTKNPTLSMTTGNDSENATTTESTGTDLSDFLGGEDSPTVSTPSNSVVSSSENKLVVTNQVAGAEVAILSVTLKSGGWVVIHEDDGTGKPGNILGAQLFDAGTFADSIVELLRGTVAGGKYYAMIHSDNNDRAFDPKMDKPVNGESGLPVMASFMAN